MAPIGGFKADSEIGVASKLGTRVISSVSPEPIPGQTIEDVARAESIFLQKVIDLHPNADGRPCIVGNCQAGWGMPMVRSA
jgi:hypothetical protein